MIKPRFFAILILFLLLFGACGEMSTPTNTATPVITSTPQQTPYPSYTPLSSLPSIADVVEKVKPAVVFISVEYIETGFFFDTISTKSGSGVILSSDGYILTNNHVVEGEIRNIGVLLPDDDRTYQAEIIGADPLGDLAVIKIEGSDFPTAEFGDPSRLRIGDWVIALGNALGLVGGPTVTLGIVGNLDRSFTIGESAFYDVIQTDAAINPGNSGGPLINLEGTVVGINTFILSSAQNIGFAVNTNTASRVYEELVAYGEVRRPYLGVRFQTVTPGLTTELGLSRDRGVLLAFVTDDGPAAQAGLQANDVVVQFQGENVTEATHLTKLLWQYEVGDTVKLTFWRGDNEQEALVTLGKRPR